MPSSRRILASFAALAGVALVVVPAIAWAQAQAVPTFHSIGLYWAGSGGSATTPCDVRYRPAGTTAWTGGYPLWFDARAVGAGTPGARPAGEYRGSLVYLQPGTTYEIELSLRGQPTTTTLTSTTWSETFPIGATHVLPTTSSSTLTITTSGTASGYELYTAPAGGTATIDVAGAQDNCIYLDASYVIIRGLTLRGAGINAIDLGPNAHDVVIEENDISGWGRISTIDGAGTNWGPNDAGVYCNNHPTVERTIIQRNRIHHPRSDTNSWAEPRPSAGGNPHPWGPQAVVNESCGGNHVFRYNEVYSDADHYFEDGIGGGENFSFEGYPRNDSDIYGNRISQVWDDGIEAEGGNPNVRVWGNHIDETYVKVAVAACSIGPIYIFRNVAVVSRWSAATDPATLDGGERGPFLKAGSNDTAYQGGRIFVFHNTILQPVDPRYTYTMGCGGGYADAGGPMTAVFSRNNILQIHKTWWDSISDGNLSPTNDFDLDLYNGGITAVAGSESNGWHDVPIYDPANPSGVWALDAASPGFDVGERLANFNDDFLGAGPDVGAYESGAPPLEFGVDAYRGGMIPRPDGGVGDGGNDGGDTPGTPDSGDTGGQCGAPSLTGGCGCRASGSGGTGTPAIAIGIVALGLALLRRRRSNFSA